MEQEHGRKIVACCGDAQVLCALREAASERYLVLDTTDLATAENWLNSDAEVSVLLCEYQSGDSRSIQFFQRAQGSHGQVRRIAVLAPTHLGEVLVKLFDGTIDYAFQKPVKLDELAAALRPQVAT